ncbi:MAG: sulfatase [Planctomycetota bacterium]|nr:sulfatase [Planctomycetota bacterium]
MLRHILTGFACCLFVGCGPTTPDGKDEGTGSVPTPSLTAVPMRLASHLADAEIQSPLLELTAAAGLESLGELKRAALLEEDFGAFDADAAGWRLGSLSGVEEGAFVLRELGRGGVYGWVFPAAPNTHYRFARRIRSGGDPGADFAVVEASGDGNLGIRGPFDNHYMAGRGLALKVHWPTAPGADGWSAGATSFFTTPATRALAVLVRPTVSQELARRDRSELAFDDLLLERLEPTPEQAIALFKGRSLAQGSDPALGVAKFGQFPPLAEIGEEYDAADGNYSYRTALYAPPPTRLAFVVTPPTDAFLQFAVCLARETAPEDAARFEVVVTTEDEVAHPLWSQEVRAAGEDWRWHAARVSLDEFAGQSVRLELHTCAVRGHPHPLWGHPTLDAPSQSAGPRNVILIAVDTLRADRLSCYGAVGELTPHLDRLAADGVRFENVAANCNWTCPSFASIFTGVVPSRHGVFSYGPRTPLPQGLGTIAEHFHAAGFATQAIAYKPPLYDGGFEQGFDIAFNVPREIVRGEDNLTEALAWLEANHDRRNFLFLHFNDPHQPFTQPDEYVTGFGPDPAEHGMQLPYSVYTSGYPRTAGQRDVVRGLYDGEVHYVDDRIGAFLEALRERGLYDDAVIGFVSDHGEQLWEHGAFGHGPSAGLNTLHDETIRVPLIVKPSGSSSVRVARTQVRAFDLMPTLIELAGIEVPRGLDAASLVPLFAEDEDDRVAIVETTGSTLALRSSRWKYQLGYGRQPEEQLFDLQADPAELVDLAPSEPETLAQLRHVTLEYLFLHRSGQYAVLIDRGPEPVGQVELTGVHKASALAGFGVRVREDSASFEGDVQGPLRLAASFTTTGALACAGLQVHATRAYVRGDLSRLLAQGPDGLHLFEGPAPLARSEGPRATMDAQQLELLKAMGYAGNDEGAEGAR